MLHSEDTTGKKKCAHSENIHMKVLQVCSARKILHFLYHGAFVQDLPCCFFLGVVLMFNQEQEQKQHIIPAL